MNKTVKAICLAAAAMIAMGIVMTGAGLLLGARHLPAGSWDRYYGLHEDDDDQSFQLTKGGGEAEAFANINVDASFLRIKLKPGKDYSVEYSYDSRYSKVSHEVKDGTLFVEEKVYRENDFNLDFLRRRREGVIVTIAYPEKTRFENVDLSGAMTDVKIQDLAADELKMDSNMGVLTLKNVEADKLVLNTEMGDINIENVSVKTADIASQMGAITAKRFTCAENLEVGVTMGSVKIAGDLTGKSYIRSEAGGVALDLSRPEEEYSYELNASVGSVKINGRSTEDRGSASKNQGANYLEINCSAGGLSVDFQ